MNHSRSEEIFSQLQKYIPGGVNSPVRAFQSVGMTPIIAQCAHGSKMTDVDGNEYIDYICSWGPLLLGHSPDFLTEGLENAVRRGLSYGIPSAIELDMAEIITKAYPSAEMIRMVNSGTEATMSAIRVARGCTGRDKILKFEGCYHGHSDALLVKSGSGALTFGVPTSPGVPAPVVADTIVCPYNDVAAVRAIFEKQGSQIACVIVEPVAGNMGLVPGEKDFLSALREITTQYGSVLIFDEVISGFRVALGGASELYGITPDMVCLGKIIGSGMPVGAYGGKKEIMEKVSPSGPIYQAGTLSGNPLAMFIGLKSLNRLFADRQIYKRLDDKGAALESGLQNCLDMLGLGYKITRCGSLLCVFFTENEIRNYDDVKHCDTQKYGKYFRAMLERGILLPPAQYECMFLSDAHTDEDIERTVKAFYASMKEVG